MRRGIALLLAVLLALLALGCAKTDAGLDTYGTTPGDTAADKPTQEKTVGIVFPNDTQTRWQNAAKKLSSGLEELGFTVRIAYGQDDAAKQAEQIETLVKDSADCLIIAAVDSLALTEALEQAKKAGTVVIAYERLLMYTEGVSCFVGFDDTQAGAQIAQRIVKEKQLETAQAESRSYTIEFCMGSAEDSTAVMMYEGILQILQPYLQSGVLTVRSGRVAFEDVAVQDWSKERAKAYIEKLLTGEYAEALPDILCAGSDALAAGCCEALEAADHKPGETWPLITGQDGTPEGVMQIVGGKQTVTAYKDYDALVFSCLTAVQQLLEGKAVQTGDASCNNGAKDVPALLKETVLIDKDNYRQELIDKGIYAEAQLDPEKQ